LCAVMPCTPASEGGSFDSDTNWKRRRVGSKTLSVMARPDK
jgi:hypothetical protein